MILDEWSHLMNNILQLILNLIEKRGSNYIYILSNAEQVNIRNAAFF